MANTITLDMNQWLTIKSKIEHIHGDKIFLISWVARRELGFTLRRNRYYTKYYIEKETICLDFFNDEMETYFRLKYL